MLMRRIIPCLDVRDGRVVKGVRFQGLRDVGDPVERAALAASGGADEVCLLDVSATIEARRTMADVVAAVRRVLDVPLTVGGGVRTVDDAVRLLDAGADKVAVNSAAVASPEILTELADRFGRQCIVLSVDAAQSGDGWQVVTHSGGRRQALDAVTWCRRGADLGAGEILLTSWDRDGTRDGYELALLSAVRAVVDVPIVASGGGDGAGSMGLAFAAGADAALAAGIFHDGTTTPNQLKVELAAAGIPVRLPWAGSAASSSRDVASLAATSEGGNAATRPAPRSVPDITTSAARSTTGDRAC